MIQRWFIIKEYHYIGVLFFIRESAGRKMKVKSRMRILISLIMMEMLLTACGSGTEDAPDAAEDMMPDEIILNPETYEDYIKLTDTYLQMDNVMQALVVLDEGIEKLSAGAQGIKKQDADLLSQRKEYILAGTVAIRTELTENGYDDEGVKTSGRVSEYDRNGNEIKTIYYGADGEIRLMMEYQYDRDGNQIEYKYQSYDSDGSVSSFTHETWAYDVYGNEIEYVSYDENGNVEEKTEHEYDAFGNKIRYEEYDKDGESAYKIIYNYDERGNRILLAKYEEGKLENKSEWEYDENDNVKKAVFYEGHVNIIGITEFEYDENGNKIKEAHYDGAENVDYWDEYEYDENGNKIKEVHYDDTGSVDYWDEYEYDRNGNLSKQVSNFEDSIDYTWEYEYDESSRIICRRDYIKDVVTSTWEYVYDERGNQVKEIYTNYDWETGQKTFTKIDECIYDENGNMTKYDSINYRGEESESFQWEREYDENGRKSAFYLYDNEKTDSYQSKTEYDEDSLMISYTGCDKNGNVLVRKETEYDKSGKVIKESYYDADGNLIQYYENEYDDFGSITRQARYKDGILKSEKQVNYAYRYIGNIDAEDEDYLDKDMTPAEYNLKQKDIFTRFLNGQGKIRYHSKPNSLEEGIIVEETITDLIDFAYYKEHEESPEYTFLDMTGDGIEELIISCSDRKLYVIQCNYGALSIIFNDVGEDYGTYVIDYIKYNGRIGICCSIGGHVAANGDIYYFLDEDGKKEIHIGDYYALQEDGAEVGLHDMYDNDSYEYRDISEGEYYDFMCGMITKIDIDWQKLEEPDYGND